MLHDVLGRGSDARTGRYGRFVVGLASVGAAVGLVAAAPGSAWLAATTGLSSAAATSAMLSVRATADEGVITIEQSGCRAPWRPQLASPDDAVALSLSLSHACLGRGSGTAAERGGARQTSTAQGRPEDGARPGELTPLVDMDLDGVREVGIVPALDGPLDADQDLTVRSGATGDPLWRHQTVGQLAGVAAGRFGPDALPGVVVADLVRTSTFVQTLEFGNALLDIQALGPDGSPLWRHRVGGLKAWTPDVAAEVDLAWVAGAADMVGDAATDVAVVRSRALTVLGNPVRLFAVDVIDGATGRVAGTATIDGTTFPWVDIVGDVDGDGKADLALNMPDPDTETDVELWRGDGSQLWQAALPKAEVASLRSVDDLDGDGMADLVAHGGSVDGGWVLAMGGQLGATIWRTDAAAFADVFAPGDVDGDGRADVGVADVDLLAVLLGTGPSVGVRHRVIGNDGNAVHAVEDHVQATPALLDAIESGGFVTSSVVVVDAGDVDADGRADRWFEVAAEVSSFDGPVRSGIAALRRGNDLALIRTLDIFQTWPLGGSLDGDGADLVIRSSRSDGEFIGVEDGRTGAFLAQVATPSSADFTLLQAVDLDSVGPAEVIATVHDATFRIIASGVLVAPDLDVAWWLGQGLRG